MSKNAFKVVNKARRSSGLFVTSKFSKLYLPDTDVHASVGTIGLMCFEKEDQALIFSSGHRDSEVLRVTGHDAGVRPHFILNPYFDTYFAMGSIISELVSIADTAHRHDHEVIARWHRQLEHTRDIPLFKAPAGTVCHQSITVLN